MRGPSRIDNIETIKKLYEAAEGRSLDLATFSDCFSQDSYFLNVPTDLEFRGETIALVASGMADAFPEVHRQILKMYAMDNNVVVVELAIRGTHTGPLTTPNKVISPTERR